MWYTQSETSSSPQALPYSNVSSDVCKLQQMAHISNCFAPIATFHALPTLLTALVLTLDSLLQFVTVHDKKASEVKHPSLEQSCTNLHAQGIREKLRSNTPTYPEACFLVFYC